MLNKIYTVVVERAGVQHIEEHSMPINMLGVEGSVNIIDGALVFNHGVDHYTMYAHGVWKELTTKDQ